VAGPAQGLKTRLRRSTPPESACQPDCDTVRLALFDLAAAAVTRSSAAARKGRATPFSPSMATK